MRRKKPRHSLTRQMSRALLFAMALGLSACTEAQNTGHPQRQSKPIGVLTTLPIFWTESDDLRAHLRSDAPPHWVLSALQRHGEVRPLDSLMPEVGALANGEIGMLIMAQPRALAPEENVALDAWVRAGGRLLLFADPMLTEESAFPLGDKRRPQDMVLLSPILDHWKLRLLFDEDQMPGERQTGLAGITVPVNLPGHFQVAPGSRHCELLGEGLAAQCRLDKGHVLLVADAALLEQGHDSEASGRIVALDRLLKRLAEAK